MRRQLLPTLATATLTTAALLAAGTARAARPTTVECLAASDASLAAGNAHKLRAERSELLVCAAASCPADIRKECAQRVEEVSRRVPTVIFEARDAAGSDLSAVHVTMDGELLAERLDGTALSIDPGEHTFLFQAVGQSAVTRRLVVRQGQKDRREAVAFHPPPSATPPPAPAAAIVVAAPLPAALSPAPLPPSPRPVAPAPEGAMSTQRVLALLSGGIGVVGLGVGAAFGAMAIAKRNDAQAVCPAQCSTPDGVNEWSDATLAGNVSTAALLVGGVALVGAGVLWWSAPGLSRGTSAQVGLGPGGVQVRGVW